MLDKQILHSDFGSDNGFKAKTIRLENLNLIAGAVDFFGIENLIDNAIQKESNNPGVPYGTLVKALIMQCLQVPYQSLYNTQEFYSDKPFDVLFNGNVLNAEDFNRVNMARMLDAVYEYGIEKLFTDIAVNVFNKIKIDVTAVHLDSTSFHYDGKSREEQGCEIVLRKGYSRDGHPELNQINALMMVDTLTRIPLWHHCVSGNTSDNTSFNEAINKFLPFLQQQFKELQYLVGDSALCTAKNLQDAKEKNIKIVTRVPDKDTIAKECFSMDTEGKFTPVNKDEPLGPQAMWCGNKKLGDVELKMMMVINPNMKGKKTETYTNRAKKEEEQTKSAVKKFSTQPFACKADAEKAVNKLEKSLKYCKLADIKYETIEGYAHKGRHKKDELPISKGVIVFAEVSIMEDVLELKINESLRYIIATTDITRDWTMADLLAIYHRQSAVERGWRCIKDPKILVCSIFLKKPSRIATLMWLMTLGLLVYCAMEYHIRKTMQDNELWIPTPDNRYPMYKPTLLRLLTYISRCETHLNIVYKDHVPITVNFTCAHEPVKELLRALEPEFSYYYTAAPYSMKIYQMAAED